MNKLKMAVPSLKDFMHRQKITFLYRRLLRLTTITKFPEHRSEVVSSFRSLRSLPPGDLLVSRGVVEGTRSAEFLERSSGASGAGDWEPYEDPGEGEDGDNRVGVDWPWERSSR